MQSNNNKQHILVTGSAGFIGYHMVQRLLKEGYRVTGIDNINDYYDVNLKYRRLSEAGIEKSSVTWGKIVISTLHPGYHFIRLNLEDKEDIDSLFAQEKFSVVVNLAAQAGVRYSIDNPDVYIKSNITGFYNILEACRHHPVDHLVYASSSSIYGDTNDVPFTEQSQVDNPISLYAATKKSNELMAHTYSHLYRIPATGLRFFTVYGPWGRPDMALSLFTERIINGEPIKVFNNGDLSRDFTYIDDIIEGVMLTLKQIPSASDKLPPYKILNIGNGKPVQLMDFIRAIEQALGKKAIIDFQPMQAGDVHETWADTNLLAEMTGYKPNTALKNGVNEYVNWHKNYMTRIKS